MPYRIAKINQRIREELSEMLQREVRDPRLSSFVSVNEVDTAPDLKFAKVYVSHLDPAADHTQVLSALTAAAGFLRSELFHRLDIRYVPELTFLWDDTIERGVRLNALIDRINEGGQAK